MNIISYSLLIIYFIAKVLGRDSHKMQTAARDLPPYTISSNRPYRDDKHIAIEQSGF
jgi:hypothetical protein